MYIHVRLLAVYIVQIASSETHRLITDSHVP